MNESIRCLVCGRTLLSRDERKLTRCTTCWVEGLGPEARKAYRDNALIAIRDSLPLKRDLTEAELWWLGWFGVTG